jgi:Cu(I)/Ag(I) efflux system protein CusF
MAMPFSVALQLALVLACLPAITLTVLAAQIIPPAEVDSRLSVPIKRESAFSNAPIAHAQKLIPGDDVSPVIMAASETPGHKEPSAPTNTKTAVAADIHPAKGIVLHVEQAKATVKIDHDPIPGWVDKDGIPFRLKERALAAQVKEGDAVEFFLEKSDSDYLIVKFGKPTLTKESH